MLFKNLKILYVEDEEFLHDIMNQVLSYEVKEIYFASNGQQAYEIYKEKKPEIIISAIDMPVMNGLEFVSKVRENDHTVKIIMLTDVASVDVLLAATELKLTKYLKKPIDGNDLYEALKLALSEINKFRISQKENIELSNGLLWDKSENTLSLNNKEIHLTPKEKKIIDLLFTNQNITITYDKLFYEVWDDTEFLNIDSVKTMIKSLRKKLPKNTIKNIYGSGFKVEN